MLDILAAIVAGGAIKHVDYIEDKKRGKGVEKWLLGILAGLCMGYVLAFSPAAILFVGIIAAQVLMGKIDKPVHGTAVVLAAVVPFVLGMGWANTGLLLPFFAVAALDEVELAGVLKPMRQYRLWLKGTALAVGAISGVWSYFVVLMAFDLAYLAVSKLADGGRIVDL
ncbi:MAG: hypothetical protein ACLFUZ_01765 [Candidatus Micrarchaeia archaeon]